MNKNNVIITFIIPVYNTNIEFLHRCIASILQYKLNNIQIIIIDDGSSYNVYKEIESISSTNEHIEFYVQENSGVSVARNQGIRYAVGKYIMFIDPDDTLGTEIKEIEAYLSKNNFDIVLFDVYFSSAVGEKKLMELGNSSIKINKNELIKNTLFYKNIYNNYQAGAIWGKAFKRKFLESTHIKFNHLLRKAQDREFMLYVYSETDLIAYLKNKSYVYFQNVDSVCNKVSKSINNKSHMFLSEVSRYHTKYPQIIENWDTIYSKIEILLFFEILYLNIFHINNKSKKKKREVIEEYQICNIKNAVKIVKISDFNSINEKVKYILIKYKLFFFLKILIHRGQSKLHQRK
jgi:glycosyltransferase involved in cell wall biosynthesis